MRLMWDALRLYQSPTFNKLQNFTILGVIIFSDFVDKSGCVKEGAGYISLSE